MLLPWRTLGEQFSILEAGLQERILLLSVEENFTPALAHMRRRPGNILPGCLPMATASLEADPELAALRFKLVPSTLSEEQFWRCYFWAVANIKCEMLNDFATANQARREAVLADDAALEETAVTRDEARGAHAAREDAFVELTLDDEFERLVGSDE